MEQGGENNLKRLIKRFLVDISSILYLMDIKPGYLESSFKITPDRVIKIKI